MRTIRKTELSNVVALIGVGYEHLYSKMKQILTAEELSYFASPIRNTNSIEWSTQIQGQNVRYDQLDDQLKNKLAAEIEDAKEKISKKLALHSETKAFAVSIFTLPTKDSIVFIKTQDGRIQPIITEWGLRSAKAGFNGDPLKHYIDRPKVSRQEVNILVHFHNDSLPVDRSINVKIDDTLSTQKLDDMGMLRLGKIFIGSNISLQNPTTKTHHVKSIVTVENQTDYNVTFDYMTSGQMIIKDQNDNIQPNTTLRIQNHNIDKNFVSDRNGLIELSDLLADTPLKATLVEKAEISTTFHTGKDTPQNQFVFVIKNPEYINADIVILDQNDDRVSNYSIIIDQDEKSQEYQSNNKGIVSVNQLQVGESINVSDKNNPNNKKQFIIEKDKPEYYFRIERDVPAQVAVQLLDHKNNPVSQAGLDVAIGDKTFTDFTDDEGKIYFSNEGLPEKAKGNITARVKDEKGKTKLHNKKFKYSADENLYVFKLKFFDKRWLLLLLLALPFLLLIEQNKDIHIKTVDNKTEKAVPYIPVSLEYVRYSLYDKGKFFTKDVIERMAVSDSMGIAKFDSINYTWYSLFTKTFKKAKIHSHSDCYGPDEIEQIFHAMWHKRAVIFPITAILMPIDFYVIDAENKNPVANAKVYVYYKTLHESLMDSARTDAAGRVEFYNIPQCSLLDTLYASAYAYQNDTLFGGILVDLMSKEPLRRTFKLKPVKESIEFFVTDCRSNQPLPDAEATIYFDDETLGTETVMTNVNGVGRGIYKDVHIKKKVKIVVNKPYYLVGEHDRGYTVDEFIKLGEKERTICLEPENLSIDFYNIDENNSNPLAGVRNTIKLISGKDTTSLSSTSNNNGVFQVPGINAGSQISIVSTYDPYYHKNDTSIKNVAVDDLLADIANTNKRTIPLKPKTFNLQFRTIDGEDGSLVPNVRLKIMLDGQPFTAVGNSNSGIFEIESTYNSTLSIEAEADGYDINDTTIRSRLFGALAKASPLERDIPMSLPKCNFKSFSDMTTNSIMEWNMGEKKGTFLFEYYTDTVADKIEVFQGRKQDIDNLQPIFKYTGATGLKVWEEEPITYNGSSIITVKVTGNSTWNYIVNCPN
jgi:hypothetical protein